MTTTVANYHDGKSAFFNTYKDCVICDLLREGRMWEKHMHRVFEEYISKDAVVIEGGCHIGTHTIKIAHLCKHLYAFEPLASSHDLLKENIKLNNISNVSLSSDGLSDTAGKARFDWIASNNPGGSGLTDNPMGKGVFGLPEEQLDWMSGTFNRDELPGDDLTINGRNLKTVDEIRVVDKNGASLPDAPVIKIPNPSVTVTSYSIVIPRFAQMVSKLSVPEMRLKFSARKFSDDVGLTQRSEVNLITIDSLGLDKLDFIKLDIEGYEEKAVKGGMETITKYKPVITLESWKDHAGAIDYSYTEEKYKDLLDVGYRLVFATVREKAPDFLFIPV